MLRVRAKILTSRIAYFIDSMLPVKAPAKHTAVRKLGPAKAIAAGPIL